jgi:hypothetical protein
MKWSIKGYKLPTPQKMMTIGRAIRRFFATIGASMFLTSNYPILAVICIFAGEFVDLIMNCFSEDSHD